MLAKYVINNQSKLLSMFKSVLVDYDSLKRSPRLFVCIVRYG